MPDPKSTARTATGRRGWIRRALRAMVFWPVELWRPIGICAASGGMLALAYPGWDVSWLLWVALVPMLAALWFLVPGTGWRRVAKASVCGWAGGFVFFLVSLFWITEVSAIGWIAICVYLAGYFAAWAGVATSVARPRLELLQSAKDSGESSWTKRMFESSIDSLRVAILCSATWTALEWIRSWMFTGFGWNGLGVALHDNPVLIQIADIVGVTGLSFFVMLAISTITTTGLRLYYEVRHARVRPHADFFAVLAVFMALFFYGTEKIEQHSPTSSDKKNNRTLKCLVIQPNIPQEVKWDQLYAPDILTQFYEATAAGADEDTALVVWPETAIPYALDSKTTEDFLNDVLKLGNFALAVGINDVQNDEEFYNAMAVFKGDYASARVYRKVHLVPFGEYIPLRKSFPPFAWIAGNEVTGDFNRGTELVPLPLPGSDPNAPTEIVPLICFEDTVGELARQFVTSNAQMMVTVTNNGWFNESANSVQHVANAKFRCIELRKPMLRSANTGITCHIDPTGRLVSHVHDPVDQTTFISGALITHVQVAAQDSPTFYAQHGDLFSKALCIIVSCSLLACYLVNRRRL